MKVLKFGGSSVANAENIKKVITIVKAGSDQQIVVVSASPENWIKKWADKNDIALIATKLQTKDNLLTGYIDGINNNGDEKAVRIKAEFDLAEYSDIYCYGDSSGDKAMLALGTKAFYKPFRK